MPATMAKKKPKPRDADRHKQPRESFHLPADLRAALERYIDDARPPTDKSKVMRVALEEFLGQQGYWPPPPQQQPQGEGGAE